MLVADPSRQHRPRPTFGTEASVTETMRQLAHSTGKAMFRTLRTGPPPPERLPRSPETDDGNCWVTGRCWLWCGREAGRVLWLGPATVAGTTTGLYACESCIRVLAEQIYAESMGIGLEWGLDHLAHGPPTGRHRRAP